jgi:ribosomal protein S18 acetylase RimI-like enzyme
VILIKSLKNNHLIIAEEIGLISKLAYQVEADWIGVKAFPPLNESVQCIQDSSHDFFGLYKQQSIVAVIEIKPAAISEIQRLVVHPKHFSQGCASQLLDHAIQTYKNLNVCTAKSNSAAIKLYFKKGFRALKSTTTKEGIELMVMTNQC